MPVEITCPSCLTTNRVPQDRLGDKPKCGQCKNVLFNYAPEDMSDNASTHYFAHTDIPLIVDFWAEWCGPCQPMSVEFAKAARVLEPRFRLLKVNIDKAPGLARQFNVRSIPTLMVLKKGQELDRHVGAMSSGELGQWAEAVTSPV